MLAHVGGMPVEESLLALVPLGAAGVAAMIGMTSARVQRWRRATRGARVSAGVADWRRSADR